MGSLVACPFQSRGAVVHNAPPTGDDLEEEEEDEDLIRIPIEIRPRGRLGLKSARSWGRGGGGGHSALSLDLDHPEMERARREWAFSIQSREQELQKLRGRMEALELRHRRACTELKALQRTCASLKRERHQALVAEQQALARAKLFLGERDRLRRQLAVLSEAAGPPKPPPAPQELPCGGLTAARCLFDIDLAAASPLALLERFVGWKWRLDSSNACDGVVRLAVTSEEADLSALRAAAAPFPLHALQLPPGGPPPPPGFELAPPGACAAACRRLAAREAARTAPSPLSRLWRPLQLRRRLSEQRHRVLGELAGLPGDPRPSAAVQAHLEAAAPRPALRVAAEGRQDVLRWLRGRLEQPGAFYFDGGGGGGLLLLRQFLSDHLAPCPGLLTPPCGSAELQREIRALLAASGSREAPLVVVFDGASAAEAAGLFAEPVPPCVKVFLLDEPEEGELEELEDSEDLRRLLAAILDAADLSLLLWRHSALVCRLLERRLLRTSYRGVAFRTAAGRAAACALLSRHHDPPPPPEDLSRPAAAVAALCCGGVALNEVSATLEASSEGLASSAFFARCVSVAGRPQEAVTLLSRAWECLEANLEPEDGRLGWCVAQLAVAMETVRRSGDAQRLRRQLAVGWEAASWGPEERAARAEAVGPEDVAEAALLGLVAKEWLRLATDLGPRLEEAPLAEVVVAWQAMAVAQGELGRPQERARAVSKALEAAVAMGDENTAAGVRGQL